MKLGRPTFLKFEIFLVSDIILFQGLYLWIEKGKQVIPALCKLQRKCVCTVFRCLNNGIVGSNPILGMDVRLRLFPSLVSAQPRKETYHSLQTRSRLAGMVSRRFVTVEARIWFQASHVGCVRGNDTEIRFLPVLRACVLCHLKF